MGRASKYGEETVRFIVRLPRSVGARADASAARSGLTRSEWLVSVIARACDAPADVAPLALRKLSGAIVPVNGLAGLIEDERISTDGLGVPTTPDDGGVVLRDPNEEPDWHSIEPPDPETCPHTRKEPGGSGLLRCVRCHKLML